VREETENQEQRQRQRDESQCFWMLSPVASDQPPEEGGSSLPMLQGRRLSSRGRITCLKSHKEPLTPKPQTGHPFGTYYLNQIPSALGTKTGSLKQETDFLRPHVESNSQA
jgi:hypothetical protein